MGLRLSPLEIMAFTSKTRVIHDISFASAPSTSGFNDDTGFATATPCQLGHVVRGIILRMLYLKRKYGVRARIDLSKMNYKDAYIQEQLEWARLPTFG